MIKVFLCAVALLFGASLVQAETYTPEQLKQRMMERRAVEAAIWGMPVEPRFERQGDSKECGWLGRYLFRAASSGRQGIELGADRSQTRLRTDVPPLWANQSVV
jgi:hypothetical protein